MELFNSAANWIIKIWSFCTEKENRGYFLGGGLAGFTYLGNIVEGHANGWTTFLVALEGIAFPVIVGISVKIGCRIVEKQVFPRIKFLKDDEKDKRAA
jgi:hypothetical protein